MILPLLTLAALVSQQVAAWDTNGTKHSCDYYELGGTPCVAAHSSIRALYGTYNGPLYQLQRGSDNMTMIINTMSAGGFADASQQDAFCANTTCIIPTIYDQSGMGNHLTAAKNGSAGGGPIQTSDGYSLDFVAGAYGAPVLVNGGQKAYGIFIPRNSGYRIDHGNGTATGTQAEGMYAVFDGTNYNSNCCFDYGNAEANRTDNGYGHMEAINFGTDTNPNWVSGLGEGPWLQADLENGVWAGGSIDQPFNVAPNSPAVTQRFFTAIVKGNDTNYWALRGGDAATGTLSNYYNGPRPSVKPPKPGASTYYPMDKEGSIILGIGGDNSRGATGTFYEGAMTIGFPTDATEDMVQADIVAAGYCTTSQASGPNITEGSMVSFQNPSTGMYLGNNGTRIVTKGQDGATTSWMAVAPLHWSALGCFSFESVDIPGYYIREYNYQLFNDPPNGTARISNTFAQAATFCPQAGFGSLSTNSIMSWNNPARYWRWTNDGFVYLGAQGGPYYEDDVEDFTEQATWEVTMASGSS